MQNQTLHTTAPADARAAEPPVRPGPQLLDPREFERVAGGLPRGGWGSALDGAEYVDSVQLPRGGW